MRSRGYRKIQSGMNVSINSAQWYATINYRHSALSGGKGKVPTMSTSVYFVSANPAASKAIASFLAAQAEIGGNETSILKVEGEEYSCLQIKGADVKLMKQYIHDNPDIATNVRLFKRTEGQGKNAHDVSFMLGRKHFVRGAVLATVATRGKRGQGLSATKFLKPAG